LLEGVIGFIRLPRPWSITVLPCCLDESVCEGLDEGVNDEASEGGQHNTYLYDTWALKLGIKVSFSAFKCLILKVLNMAPTQLLPNNWALVRAFEILCDEMKRQPSLNANKVGWSSLSSQPGCSLLKPFRESYKFFKD
ncbi:hypothetical protein CR513_53984, partial [Mucuna pruriens]